MGGSRRRALQSLALATWVMAQALPGHSEITCVTSRNLSFSGEGTLILGDLAACPDGVGAVYCKPEGYAGFRLMFYLIGKDGTILQEKQINWDTYNFYEPSLCWDGTNFGVVASTLTQAAFLVLSPQGAVQLNPVLLPGIPLGGRTAAFRILWTPNGYAVFGLWGEPEYPGQTQGYYYTYLRYWLLNAAGGVLAQKDLGIQQPLLYPGSEGAERTYFDVVWTGASFFVAYAAESQTGPPLSVYTKMFDLQGNLVRGEAPALVSTVAAGPALATNGLSIGLTALKAIALEGNHLYARFFDMAGNPRANEVEYSSPLGLGAGPPYGPTMGLEGGGFVAAYCAPTFTNFVIRFKPFDATGQAVGQEYSLTDSGGNVHGGTFALGMDLQLEGRGRTLFAKAQSSNYIVNTPHVMVLKTDLWNDYLDLFDLAGAWQDRYGANDLLDAIQRFR